ncbi:polysaccharide pyruvyl transferase family protein [Chryseobacterium turcicum]|uniref:Polysaccharide pyruvyl transferase family protein n=1 Tax=Chryseobacterium turcicum TaxID=2898076 RepID=A0A9Q3V3B2_9FLAO|nr:polysaccharide pyruvyl transferase family protein [Chryseobacterium turcicum]MCD1116481.1 polysaccharide pyruvyl transferase family protein [Chryseobacterium turcicum]
MKIVLVRAYTHCNLGDDLFLKVLVDRYPNVKFRIIVNDLDLYAKMFDQYQNVTIIQNLTFSLLERIYFKSISFISKKKRKEIIKKYYKKYYTNEYDQSDLYLYIGGSLFMENIYGDNLADELDKLITSVFFDKPKFIIGANFGPFYSSGYKDFYKNIFFKYQDVCFREAYSLDVFKELPNTRMCPDVVFQLQLPSVIDKESNSIGFSLIDISQRKQLMMFTEEYKRFIIQTIKESLENDKKVYMFSFCKQEGDENVIDNILCLLPINLREKVNIVLYKGNIDDFLLKYSKVETMFCTRFHSMIISSLLNQNIFPIMYSDKMKNVLQDLNYEGLSSDIASLHNINSSEILKKIRGNKLKIHQQVIEKSKDAFTELEKVITL